MGKAGQQRVENERCKGCEMEGRQRETMWGGKERKETEDRAREREDKTGTG